jgi:hypothetical protein
VGYGNFNRPTYPGGMVGISQWCSN